MIFIAKDNPNLYTEVKDFDELDKILKECGDSKYNYKIELFIDRSDIAGAIEPILK